MKRARTPPCQTQSSSDLVAPVVYFFDRMDFQAARLYRCFHEAFGCVGTQTPDRYHIARDIQALCSST